MSDSGFIDLRISHGARGPGDDSVWPSFTDIMTVVVMIFLMALVIIMLRNTELSQELTTSIDANQAITSMNLGLSGEVSNLKDNLGSTEAERKRLNSRLLGEIVKSKSLADIVTSLETDVSSLTELKATLSAENLTLLSVKERLTRENASLSEKNQLLGEQKLGLESERTTLTTQMESLQSDKTELVEQTEELDRDRELLQQQTQSQAQKISTLAEQEQLLSSQLGQIIQQFSALRLSTETEVTTLEQTNLGLSEQIDTLNLELAQLNVELQKQRAGEQSLLEQLVVKQREYEALQTNEQLALQQFNDANVEIDSLVERIRAREEENQLLQSQASEQGSRFISLQEEYDSLEEKYRGLVRAARSAVGKQVALVYFVRNNSGYEFRLQEPGSGITDVVTRVELESRLSSLKNQHGRNLYTRVIIPEGSTLSHTEAWQFTQEILNKYDYYYQLTE